MRWSQLGLACVVGLSPTVVHAGDPPTCPIRPAPAPTGAVLPPGKVPPPRLLPVPMRPRPDAADEHFLSGLHLVRQADGAWQVDDLSGRHVATIAADGTLSIEQPDGPSPRRAADLHARPQCAVITDCQPQVSAAGAIGASALFAGLAYLADARVRRKLRVSTPNETQIASKTRAFREEVAHGWYLDAYCERLRQVQRDLNRAWVAPNDEARKRALFEIWDGLEERMPPVRRGIPAGVVERVTALRKAAIEHAREIIVLFVRARLPRGSASAYTEAELRALNRARRGLAPLSPYEPE